MPQVTFDFPQTVFSALRKSPAEFAAAEHAAQTTSERVRA
jgi:hypothetical protein